MFGEAEEYDYSNIIEDLIKPKLDTAKLDKYLSDSNFKINAFVDKKKKYTLLHTIIKANKLLAAQWLLKNQANPYTEDEHSLPAFFYFIHSPIAKKYYHLLEESNVDFSFKNTHGRIVLQDIVINGDIALYNRLITKVKKPFTLDGYGRNILFDAISSGDKETMNLVFDHEDAPLDIQDENQDSLLHFVKDGDLNLIEFLLNKGVPPTLPDIKGKNIIFYLSERIEKSSSELDIKHLTNLVDLALKSKTSQEQKDKEGNNLLMGFLHTLNKPLGNYNQKPFLTDLISKFIDSGVKIDEKNDKGDNALLLSVFKNDLETTELLLTKGAEINIQNKEGVTPLAIAIMQGNNDFAEMVELLLFYNANPNTRDEKGVTLIEKIIYILIYINKENSKKEGKTTSVAISSEDEENFSKFNEDDFIRNIFEIVTSRQMIDFKHNDSLGNPYFFILVITENNFLAELLIKSGTHINQLNQEKKNLLQYYLEFVLMHKIDDITAGRIIKNIIKMGVDLNHRDENGATVLHNSILKDSLSTTRNIINLGGSIDVTDKKGRTLLHNAIWANDIEKVKYVVTTKSALVNVPDKLGVLPINYAAFLGNVELICYLINHKSFVNNLNEKKRSTLDFFKRFHKNIFNLATADVSDKEDRKHIAMLIENMKKEFNIVE